MAVDTQDMDPAFRGQLQALVAASGGRLKIVSGFRSKAKQQMLFDAAVKKYGSEAAARKWVAKPGNSKHEAGIAADLSGDLKWAHENAAKFGLQFPLSNENWHVEPIGSRGGASKGGVKYDAVNDTGPGDPNSMGALVAQNLHDPKVQQANLLAILATPDAPVTSSYA